MLPSKDGGRSTQPSKKFVELCGGAARAQEILELHIKRVALLCRICELVQGKPPAVVSWGENAMELVALLGDRVRVLGHHMHPTRALMVFQKNWAGLEYVKHVQGSDECLTAIAKELGMTLLREDGEIWYWRRLWKNDEAARAENGWAEDGDTAEDFTENELAAKAAGQPCLCQHVPGSGIALLVLGVLLLCLSRIPPILNKEHHTMQFVRAALARSCCRGAL